MFNSVFVTFPCGILGQVWYLIVSIPDLCQLSCLVEAYKAVFAGVFSFSLKVFSVGPQTVKSIKKIA